MASFTFNLPTREQVRASRNGNTMLSAIDSDSPRQKAIMIKGCPGSGKTTISVFRLMRLVSERKRVTMLVYQHMLKTAIKNLSGGHRGHFNYCVHTLHSWYYYQTKEYYDLFNQNDPSIPNADILKQQLSKSNFANQNYYELLIDEGQDFHKKLYQSFPHFFERITVGADGAQQLHKDKGTGEFAIQEILEDYEKFNYDVKTFPLQFNYRNTYETYNFARQFVPDAINANDSSMLRDLQIRNRGDLPDIRILENDDELKEETRRLIENMSGENINIAVLLSKIEPVDVYYEYLNNNFNISKYHHKMSKREIEAVENDLQNILVTTFTSAKGMEFDFVIMPNFEKAQERYRNHYYVGCTRARNQLYILCVGDLPDIMDDFDEDTFDLTIDDALNSEDEISNSSFLYTEVDDNLPF